MNNLNSPVFGSDPDPFGSDPDPLVFLLNSMGYCVWIRWIRHFKLFLTRAHARARLPENFSFLLDPSDPKVKKIVNSGTYSGSDLNP